LNIYRNTCFAYRFGQRFQPISVIEVFMVKWTQKKSSLNFCNNALMLAHFWIQFSFAIRGGYIPEKFWTENDKTSLNHAMINFEFSPLFAVLPCLLDHLWSKLRTPRMRITRAACIFMNYIIPAIFDYHISIQIHLVKYYLKCMVIFLSNHCIQIIARMRYDFVMTKCVFSCTFFSQSQYSSSWLLSFLNKLRLLFRECV